MSKEKIVELDRTEVSVLCDILLSFDKARQIALDGTGEEKMQLLECATAREMEAETIAVLYGGEDGTEATAFLESTKEKDGAIEPLTNFVNAIKQGNLMTEEILKLTGKQIEVVRSLVISQFTYQFLKALKFDSNTPVLPESLKDDIKVLPFYWELLYILNNGDIFEEVPLLVVLILKLLKVEG